MIMHKINVSYCFVVQTIYHDIVATTKLCSVNGTASNEKKVLHKPTISKWYTNKQRNKNSKERIQTDDSITCCNMYVCKTPLTFVMNMQIAAKYSKTYIHYIKRRKSYIWVMNYIFKQVTANHKVE
jgi:hypothetical protein